MGGHGEGTGGPMSNAIDVHEHAIVRVEWHCASLLLPGTGAGHCRVQRVRANLSECGHPLKVSVLGLVFLGISVLVLLVAWFSLSKKTPGSKIAVVVVVDRSNDVEMAHAMCAFCGL